MEQVFTVVRDMYGRLIQVWNHRDVRAMTDLFAQNRESIGSHGRQELVPLNYAVCFTDDETSPLPGILRLSIRSKLPREGTMGLPSREEKASAEPRNDTMALVEWINSQGDAGEVNEIMERANEKAESER